MIGTSIGFHGVHGENMAGTFGGFVKVTADGHTYTYGLTCRHILVPEDKNAKIDMSRTITTPSPSDHKDHESMLLNASAPQGGLFSLPSNLPPPDFAIRGIGNLVTTSSMDHMDADRRRMDWGLFILDPSVLKETTGRPHILCVVFRSTGTRGWRSYDRGSIRIQDGSLHRPDSRCPMSPPCYHSNVLGHRSRQDDP
ncbi:hypothetical protein CONLIGDRAFT_223300 [Coniochaeta ligniaria NRRL 30616]|uniref:Uncharacterized protein n=1 Tax=Coniochaeta ligniaria NRRL 30616 TaxID=1408157 RepID=A0A1J7IZW6_9PEZI|nr:hypothetical protein CONLIGDRAFT_223300 [Coniochaeta ligniaria NRRL 30616]